MRTIVHLTCDKVNEEISKSWQAVTLTPGALSDLTPIHPTGLPCLHNLWHICSFVLALLNTETSFHKRKPASLWSELSGRGSKSCVISAHRSRGKCQMCQPWEHYHCQPFQSELQCDSKLDLYSTSFTTHNPESTPIHYSYSTLSVHTYPYMVKIMYAKPHHDQPHCPMYLLWNPMYSSHYQVPFTMNKITNKESMQHFIWLFTD